MDEMIVVEMVGKRRKEVTHLGMWRWMWMWVCQKKRRTEGRKCRS